VPTEVHGEGRRRTIRGDDGGVTTTASHVGASAVDILRPPIE
jgi:hypothetical protein